MSTYESEPGVEPARIETVSRARKLWRRTGTTSGVRYEDFFREFAPQVGATGGRAD